MDNKKPRIPAVANDTRGGQPAMAAMHPQPVAHIIIVPTEISAHKKVNEHGSSIEKSAVNAQQAFKRHGITVKDSRGS